jgi:hypothetical protein
MCSDVQRGGGPGTEANRAQERARHRVQDLFGNNNFSLYVVVGLSPFCVHKALRRERLFLVKEDIHCRLICPCCRYTLAILCYPHYLNKCPGTGQKYTLIQYARCTVLNVRDNFFTSISLVFHTKKWPKKWAEISLI